MNHLAAPPPRFITPRTPGSRTEGREIARLARLLGKPLMPWQRRVVDGLTELTDEGLYRYSRALITVPRQSGKTTLLGPVQMHRIMTRRNITAFYTAQDGAVAHKRMLDLIQLAQDSALSSLFVPRYASGSSGLTTPNGSKLRTFARPSNLHSETPHLVTLDEIWALDDAKGGEMMGAISPGQSTLEGESQVIMISTRGTHESTFMNKLIDLGRKGAPGMFYAEWSLEDGLDPYEPQNFWTFHPALGNTVNLSFLASEAAKALDPNDVTLSPGEYIRGYTNRLTETLDPLIPAEEWAALGGNQVPLGRSAPRRRDIAITYEVGINNECGAFIGSWRNEDGDPCVRVIHRAPGTVWMHDYAVKLYKEWKPAAFGADGGGPNKGLTAKLRRTLGDEVVATLGGSEYGTACHDFMTYATEHKNLKHDGSDGLARDVQHAVMRSINGVTSFNRERSTGPIPSLIAGAAGIWLYDNRPAPSGKPEMYI